MRIERGQLVVLVILIALVAGFVGGLWWPRTQRVARTLRLIDAREAKLVRLREEATVEVAPPIAAARAAAAPAELAGVLPPRADLGPLLEQLSSDLRDEGLTVRQLQARTTIEGTTFDRIPVELQCTGTWRALFALFRRIEAYERIVRVDRIGVAGSADEPGGSLVADIELSTFSRAVEENGP